MPARPFSRKADHGGKRPSGGRGGAAKGNSGGGSPSLADWALQGSSFDLDLQNNLASTNQFPSGTATSRLTLTRTTSGYAQFQSGTWSSFSSGQFRQTDKGLLIEEARTNNLLQNRDMTNAAWVKGATVTVAQTQVGIDGGANSATLVTGGAVTATNTVLQTITLGSAADVYSVFIKRVTGSGVIEISADGSTWTAVVPTASYQQFQVPQTLANPVCGVRITANGDQIAVDFSQLETGVGATSPILTTVAAVTRNADAVTLTNFGLIDSTQGTSYIEWQEIPGPVGTDRELYRFNGANAVGTNVTFLKMNTGNKINAVVFSSNSLTVNIAGSGSVVANTKYRAALGYSAAGYGLGATSALNAGIITNGAAATTTPPMTAAYFGSGDGSSEFLNGYIRRITWFPVKQPNATILAWAQGTIGP